MHIIILPSPTAVHTGNVTIGNTDVLFLFVFLIWLGCKVFFFYVSKECSEDIV